MFNSTSNTNLVARSASTKTNRTFKKLALIAIIATASIGAQANELSSADVVSALETRFTEATTEMLQTAKQEITLNLHSKIAEQLFELSTSLELTESVTEPDTALVSNED
ncbi:MULTISPECIES: hypothetical protein [unclassified Shewanella]|uniref:hypothetical protein n=1 Tax=unclassified Shewanella TaxID=196818 RepID=UPI000C8283B4|nr:MULTISPECIES: hypothetical protein [unclassified Shewanella]MDO6776854.1 hypothetical protein [Shewanella sp. 3_MG-2023]PMG29558.1 hypothetical protein BCU94_13320 [Shewanella sp. 10N.286.52.C2]PMG48943.1 hypothetical protein BCU91_02840 [Shewanella sp. 10N.286.52.B9]PMI00032.1 hypothetical protein BCU55_13390 [Shewanella sp. 10N.286.48.A6]